MHDSEARRLLVWSAEATMKTCDCCGNTYDKLFEVTTAEGTYTFDSFECAIHRLAPECDQCGCKIVGHGVEAHGKFFCCAHCSSRAGIKGAVDRIAASSA